jgi:predicted GTPase
MIDESLEGAQIFLPLVSADFLASDYCYQKEMHRALEKHDLNELVVVPIVVRPCAWKNSPLAKIQVLPLHGKPVANWRNHDEAWSNIIEALLEIVPSLAKPAGRRARDTSFKVGVFGTTGSGKSALCNALIDHIAVRESDIAHVSRRVKVIEFAPGADLNNISLHVCPGIGATPEQDIEYEKIYNDVVRDVDMSLWVLRSDIRILTPDCVFINRYFRQAICESSGFRLVMNMVDKMEPAMDWNKHESKPGPSQAINIERRKSYISGVLRVPDDFIIPVSCAEGYNVKHLKSQIVKAASSKHSVR